MLITTEITQWVSQRKHVNCYSDLKLFMVIWNWPLKIDVLKVLFLPNLKYRLNKMGRQFAWCNTWAGVETTPTHTHIYIHIPNLILMEDTDLTKITQDIERMCLRGAVFKGKKIGAWGPLLIWVRHLREVRGGMTRHWSRGELKQAWKSPRDQHSPSRPYLQVVNPTHKGSVKGSHWVCERNLEGIYPCKCHSSSSALQE